jgi:lysophosphatidylcholine acyltransferase/lyso-PAF acetyltransferase
MEVAGATPVASPAPGVVSPAPGAAPTAPSAAAGGGGVVAQIIARARDPRFGRVLIFPEGTCGNGEAVLQFKPGAFAPGLPVQPVAVQYPFQHLDVSWCRWVVRVAC